MDNVSRSIIALMDIIVLTVWALSFSRKLSDAVRDGNPVLAVIPSIAVCQNMNSTPLFVPNAPSLSRLFTDVLGSAKVAARDISLVEAHGTGTLVGDPAEYESSRTALRGPASGRVKKLPIRSVKGHIGHTEGASGVLALIKVIIMMRGAFIPPQASFNKMNHGIDVRADDMMEVVTKLGPWEEDHKMALINNCSACGCNASLIVVQPPKSLRLGMAVEEISQYPFWIPGLDVRAISTYAAKLSSYCLKNPARWPISHTFRTGSPIVGWRRASFSAVARWPSFRRSWSRWPLRRRRTWLYEQDSHRPRLADPSSCASVARSRFSLGLTVSSVCTSMNATE